MTRGDEDVQQSEERVGVCAAPSHQASGRRGKDGQEGKDSQGGGVTKRLYDLCLATGSYARLEVEFLELGRGEGHRDLTAELRGGPVLGTGVRRLLLVGRALFGCAVVGHRGSVCGRVWEWKRSWAGESEWSNLGTKAGVGVGR